MGNSDKVKRLGLKTRYYYIKVEGVITVCLLSDSGDKMFCRGIAYCVPGD